MVKKGKLRNIEREHNCTQITIGFINYKLTYIILI